MQQLPYVTQCTIHVQNWTVFDVGNCFCVQINRLFVLFVPESFVRQPEKYNFKDYRMIKYNVLYIRKFCAIRWRSWRSWVRRAASRSTSAINEKRLDSSVIFAKQLCWIQKFKVWQFKTYINVFVY